MKIGNKIKSIRCELQLKQRELARLSTLSIEYIGKIERGEVTNIGVNTLEKIARALNVDLIELIKEPEAA